MKNPDSFHWENKFQNALCVAIPIKPHHPDALENPSNSISPRQPLVCLFSWGSAIVWGGKVFVSLCQAGRESLLEPQNWRLVRYSAVSTFLLGKNTQLAWKWPKHWVEAENSKSRSLPAPRWLAGHNADHWVPRTCLTRCKMPVSFKCHSWNSASYIVTWGMLESGKVVFCWLFPLLWFSPSVSLNA